MCTLSIHRCPESLLVTMNRDEAIGRAPESPPALHKTAGQPAWMAPQDGEKGGAWMGVNDQGVVACLLNFYLPGESLLPDTTGRYRSRGEIIPNALVKGSAENMLAWLLGAFDPAPYPSFALHLISAEGARRLTWVKEEKLGFTELEGEWNVFSSSGWDSDETTRWREDRFAQWLAEGSPMAGKMPAFNLIQEPGVEDKSPLMKREWSATRSITQVSVDLKAGRIQMAYWPHPEPSPEDPARELSLTLNRGAPRQETAKAP